MSLWQKIKAFFTTARPVKIIKPVPKTNAAGLQLIKDFEELRLHTYDDATGRPIKKGAKVKGHRTIGYGHKLLPEEMHIEEIAAEYAEDLFLKDILIREAQLDALLYIDVNSNQYSALLSFVFNLGAGAFSASTLRKRVNEGRFKAAGAQFGRWVYFGPKGKKKKLKGLVRRRKAERELFLYR